MISRRNFLRSASAALALPAGLNAAPVLDLANRLLPASLTTTYPFTLGVASGSPLPDGVVLWTRLAPEPIQDGGMPPIPVPVRWEVAHDEQFRRIVRSGTATADPSFAHSVHVEVSGLAPARWYWYRFMAAGAVSPAGRTRTAPAVDADIDRFRFAFASCQQYEQGWFAAHRHMAEEDLDLVVFLGDYIYESSWGKSHVRKHEGPEPRSLAQYRNRYARYKTDPDLQRCHARFPWIVTWDDHEVVNDYANDRPPTPDPAFLARRAAAYRAYYEHMPLRSSALPVGPDMKVYGHHDFGRLVRFHVLDDRQYRDHQVCVEAGRGGSGLVNDQNCPDRRATKRSMLGAAQEAWMEKGFVSSRARWNIVAQQTLMAQVDLKPAPDRLFWTDGWDGYPAARQRLLAALSSHRVSNPIVIGGDVHFNCVADLRLDFDKPESPTVATEFCGTSITSQSYPQTDLDIWKAKNPHLRYANSEKRGYIRMELTKRQCMADLRVIENEKRADTPVITTARFRVQSGKPGALKQAPSERAVETSL